MNDIEVFIAKITESLNRANAHLEDSAFTGETVYRDEPILTTAAKAREALPEKYREMRRIGEGDPSLLVSEIKRFVSQAKFMEDFEDSYEYKGEFFKYFPTYRHMSDRQLRGYFSWRTDVRHGVVKETSLSFVYVYLYELINLIGAADPKDAIGKFDSFVAAYLPIDRSIRRYAPRWRRDMAIYYGVPEAFSDGKSPLPDFSVYYSALESPKEAGEDAVFKALVSVSSVNPEKTARYKADPEETKKLYYRIFCAYTDYCTAKRKISLAQRLLGTKTRRPYVIFPSAIFYEKDKKTDREFTSPGGAVYRRCRGEWTVEGYPETGSKNHAVGALVREIDAVLKEADGGNRETSTVSKTFGAIAHRAIETYREEKRREAASKIEFDFSALDSIREVAEATAAKLVTEDEFLPEEEDDFLPEYAENEPGSALEKYKAPLLTEEERETLRLIIGKKDAAGYSKSHGLMLSVVIESINEKLYEELLDNAIEYDGNVPVAVEDYIEELKGVIGE